MRIAIIVLAMLGLMASCSSEVNKLNPKLRRTAYDAYQLSTYPCERSDLTQMRRVALQPMIATFAKYEKQASGTIAGTDFALAKQTIDYEIADGANWNCGFDGIPDSELNFEHHKRWLEQANADLAKLTATGSEKSEVPKWINVANAAKFRSIAINIYDSLDPLCPVTVDEGRPDFQEGREAIAALASELSGSPYEQHLEVARADSEYLRSVTVVECSEPLSGEAGRMRVKESDTWVVLQVGQLKTLAGKAQQRPQN
ncbi:MAG: hypothetical protein WA793_09060 [Sphingorhabdus sp.]|uniref:hypothetical protein n=1 Tax=Sphingorhabdus sp. TaxID=1902408 RepID=UPI003C8EEE73